jgi:hypothetical protein
MLFLSNLFSNLVGSHGRTDFGNQLHGGIDETNVPFLARFVSKVHENYMGSPHFP